MLSMPRMATLPHELAGITLTSWAFRPGLIAKVPGIQLGAISQFMLALNGQIVSHLEARYEHM